MATAVEGLRKKKGRCSMFFKWATFPKESINTQAELSTIPRTEIRGDIENKEKHLMQSTFCINQIHDLNNIFAIAEDSW